MASIQRIINSKYRDRIQLKVEGIGDNTVNLLMKARQYVQNNGIVFKHVWIVYDTDDFPAENIDMVAQLCEEYNAQGETIYHAVWSNQCVELWYLLHFMYMDTDIDRSRYWPKLSDWLKNIGAGSYEKNRPDMYEVLRPYMDIAIANAKRLDKQNRRTLEYVNVSVPGSSVGTVTNADGEFSLKIEDAEMVFALEISHIGYHNNRVRLDKEHLSDLKIYLTPHANMLNEIVVYAHNPRFIVEEAIRKIPVNYSNKNNMLTGFYRETVQKGRRYINISEAIIDVYKTSYEDMTTTRDRVQVLKGRRLLSQRASDTLGVKLAGGPTLSIYVDIVKNQDALLDVETLNYYDFFMEEPVQIDNRQQYVISFRPRVVLPYALYYGKLYIDRDKLSFTRAEFSLSMDNKVKAVQAILVQETLWLTF